MSDFLVLDAGEADDLRATPRSGGAGGIVLAEDEPTLARNVARFLRRRGYSVDVAGTVAHARELCRTLAPRILLTDLDLPDGNGLVLIDELCGGASSCKVVLITAQGDAELARDALRRGARRCLEKPVPLERLAAVIEELEAG